MLELLNITQNPKIVHFITLVTESADYDDDFVKDWLEIIITKWNENLQEDAKARHWQEAERKFQQEKAVRKFQQEAAVRKFEQEEAVRKFRQKAAERKSWQEKRERDDRKKKEYELKKLELQSKLQTSNHCSPASSWGLVGVRIVQIYSN